ncbi:DNA methyltransferase, partial [bacterium]
PNFGYGFITSSIVDGSLMASNTCSSTYLFPLYLYPDNDKKDLLGEQQSEKKPNIPDEIFEKLASAYGEKPTPEDILYYIYGVFYSNIYREKYAEFLKIDFPRVPFTSDFKVFKRIGELGKRLADLHLLESSLLDMPIAKYHGVGDNNKIERVKYDEAQRRIYINDDKYFDNVAPDVWNYHIGGYRVLQKYLKDRKGRIMDDAPRYCRIITAIAKTIEIQDEIDRIYPDIETATVEFSRD